MRNIFLLVLCAVSISINAEYRVNLPLEVSNNGQLPDGSIVFIDNTLPVTPEEPEASDCSFDISSSTLIVEVTGYGEVVQIQFNNGNRIVNGIKGKAMMAQMPAIYYELCMNGQQPIPFVEESEWENGDCKYNSGLGTAPPRYWIDTYDFDDHNIKLFLTAVLGTYENKSLLSLGTPGVIFPSEWIFKYPFDMQITNNKKIIYNGYQYSKGKLIDTREEPKQDDDTIIRPLYYYEVCRSKI